MGEIHENQLGEVLTYQFEPVLNKILVAVGQQRFRERVILRGSDDDLRLR